MKQLFCYKHPGEPNSVIEYWIRIRRCSSRTMLIRLCPLVSNTIERLTFIEEGL